MSDQASRHDRLRSALRRGDPLGEGELSHAEVGQLRARVLAAADAVAPSSRRLGRRPFVWVGAGVATVALIAGLTGWLVGPAVRLERHVATTPHTSPESVPDAVPKAASTAIAQGAAIPPGSAPAVVQPGAAKPGGPGQPSRVSGPSVVGHPSRPPSPDADSRPRQLQFITPGGTRIVWVLNPTFSLALGAPQQEDPRWSGE